MSIVIENPELSWDCAFINRMRDQLADIQASLYAAEASYDLIASSLSPRHRLSALNLLHYLAFRQHDVRQLQDDLASIGLSSLGRAESNVMHSIDQVLKVLCALAGEQFVAPLREFAVPDHISGPGLLTSNTVSLLGEIPFQRSVRIMVTMPSEAGDDRKLIADLISNGMNCARINCAHDDTTTWMRMIEGVRAAEADTGSPCRIHMDVAGPKLRTGPVGGDSDTQDKNYLLLKEGDILNLTKSLTPGAPAILSGKGKTVRHAHIGCTLPEVFSYVKKGERIWFDDGKIGGVIEKVTDRAIQIRITKARAKGRKLRGEKGINLPDSRLRLPALTTKDHNDLDFIAANADMVGLSFVQSVTDVDDLIEGLKQRNASTGVVLKVETMHAFELLPELILAAMKSDRIGVMIARGDLAVECGYERLAEVQEEILWLCEAAHVPVIWATQVLENLAQTGQPSRAEITDAAMGVRAECVMLNKGPYVAQAVHTLDDILHRMEAHQSKKRSLLRRLMSWGRTELPSEAQ